MKKFRLVIWVVITALTAYLIFSHLSCKEKVEGEVAGENFVTIPYDVTDYLDSAPDFQIQNIATTTMICDSESLLKNIEEAKEACGAVSHRANSEVDFSGLVATVEDPISIEFGDADDCRFEVNEPNIIVCDKSLSEFINRMYLIMTNADSNDVKIIFTDGVLTENGFD